MTSYQSGVLQLGDTWCQTVFPEHGNHSSNLTLK